MFCSYLSHVRRHIPFKRIYVCWITCNSCCCCSPRSIIKPQWALPCLKLWTSHYCKYKPNVSVYTYLGMVSWVGGVVGIHPPIEIPSPFTPLQKYINVRNCAKCREPHLTHECTCWLNSGNIQVCVCVCEFITCHSPYNLCGWLESDLHVTIRFCKNRGVKKLRGKKIDNLDKKLRGIKFERIKGKLAVDYRGRGVKCLWAYDGHSYSFSLLMICNLSAIIIRKCFSHSCCILNAYKCVLSHCM